MALVGNFSDFTAEGSPEPEHTICFEKMTDTQPSTPTSRDGSSKQEDTLNDAKLGPNGSKSQKVIDIVYQEYIKLDLKFESQLIKHRLAVAYYDFRAFYFHFVPVTFIAALITVLGFLVSGGEIPVPNGGDGDENDSISFTPLVDETSKQILSLTVGALGAVSTLLNALGKRNNYQSQTDMHRSAVKALEKMRHNIEFERDKFDRRAPRTGEFDGGRAGADLETHQASFKAMLDACGDSQVPCEVEQAFTVLERVYFEREKKLEIGLVYFYHKLWKEYSKLWYWPSHVPTIDVTKKYGVWKKELEDDKQKDIDIEAGEQN